MFLFMLFIAVSVTEIVAIQNNIQSEIQAYFTCEAVKSFEAKWKPYQKVFQNILSYTLQQGFGHTSLNLYKNKLLSPLTISSGYYHSDNQVKLIFRNMELDELPHLYNAKVNLPLYSNALSLDASISKIIVHTSYIAFRNKSDIIFNVADQDPYKSSPFRFQQVKNNGDLAITITGCSLSGVIVTTLSGKTVNLGHQQFKLKDCQYSFEIYSPGTGVPPVIANYLPNGVTGTNLEVLLLPPLLEELAPKLQSSMFSEVNISTVLTEKLSKICDKQESIFEKTKNYLDEVVRSMNKKSIENNMGTMNLNNFTLAWDDTFTDLPNLNCITLTKMVLMGLDTVYSSHSGGPLRLTDMKIMEQLRFSTLEVMGSIVGQEEYQFAVQITDYAVDVTLDSNLRAKFEVLGWRSIEFSCPKLEFSPAESLVVGYLLSEVPERIKSHLNSVYNGDKSPASFSLHDIEYIEENANDGKYGMSQEYYRRENINDVKAELDEEEKEQVNDVEAKSDVKNPGYVKLHNVVAPRVKEQGPIKLHHVQATPHEENHGPTKLHNVAAVPHDKKHDENVHLRQGLKTARNMKAVKRSQKQLLNAHLRKSNHQIRKEPIRRLNRLFTEIPESGYTSDNEIRSN